MAQLVLTWDERFGLWVWEPDTKFHVPGGAEKN